MIASHRLGLILVSVSTLAWSTAGLFTRAITENLDLTRHMNDAVQSLAICLAADESVRSGQPVKLGA